MSEAEQQWYFISVINQEQYGPYTAEQLEGFVANGSITRETMIWTEALEDQWIPATNVEGLFPDPAAQGSPPPAAQPAQLLTGPAAQSRPPLGAAPLQARPLQAAPIQTTTAQPATLLAQPAALAPQRQVVPGMIPAAMPTQQPAAAPAQPAALAPQRQAAPGMIPSTMPTQQPAAAPAQPAALAPQRQVAPGMIPSTMPGTAQQTVPPMGGAQAAAPASIVAPGELFPPPAATNASFGLFLGLPSSAIVLFIVAALIEKLSFLFFPAVALLAWTAALSYIYIYRAWRLIQPGNVRTTPGKAVGFLFIPFFQIYWIFVAIVGLPKEWNRVMAAHPNLQQGPRLNSGLALAFGIAGLFGIGLILIFPLMAGICKGINWMGRLHMMRPSAQSPGGAASQPQAGGPMRLY